MISRFQNKFSNLFIGALEKQLILKKILTPEDWQIISNQLRLDFAKDNHYSELKDLEILKDRIEALNSVDPYLGKYFSSEWIRKTVLRQNDADIERVLGEIEVEMKQGIIQPPEPETNSNSPKK